MCEPSLIASAPNSDDLMTFQISTAGKIKKYGYFVTTYGSAINQGTGNGWPLSYLKCKYYARFVVTAYFYFSDTNV